MMVALAPCSTTISERMNTELGLSLPAANTRWIGRLISAPLAMRMTTPSPISAVLSATAASSVANVLPTCCATSASPVASACAIEPMVSPGSGFKSDKFRRENAIDEHQPPAIDAGENVARRLGVRFRRRIGRRGKRIGLAHQRAQVGVFPFLDAAMRQALLLELLERVRAQRRQRALAGQLAARRLIGSGQRLLGVGLDGADFGVHAAASSWNSA